MIVENGFDPKKDGWSFHNWGEAPLSWELYREAYLGISSTDLKDILFYQIFKNIAEKGNCGGMSVLALAIYKYGGYMGFCSPANFFKGGIEVHTGPDRDDLHRIINILQARQFSANGIRNFLDILNAKNLNNAGATFNKIRELFGIGDYPVLSIANSPLGEIAHTVIPYKIEDYPNGGEYPAGTKIIYIWDPNHPYIEDEKYKDHKHYDPDSMQNRLVIRGQFDWVYAPGGNIYEGKNNGWCFPIPISLILKKARHCMSLDIVFDAVMKAFVSGPK